MPIVKKIHRLESAQCASLDRSKSLVLSDVIKIVIFLKYSRAQAIRMYSLRAEKTIQSHLKQTVTSKLDKDEIVIVDKTPKPPTQCELRHAIGVLNTISIFC